MRTAIQAILTFLLNSVWQAAAVLAFAAICDWLLRGLAARYRHGLWILALILSALLPVWSAVRATRSPSLAKQDQIVAPVGPNPTVTSRIITPGVDEAAPLVADTAPPQPTKILASNRFPSTIHVSRNVAIALATIYGLFVLFGFLRLFRSWRRTLSILKNSYECELTTTVRSVVDKCESVFGLKRTRVRVSTHVAVPITLGLLRPTIILPESLLREADQDLLMSAIGHEMVHVARRDYLWNLVFEISYVPLSFHPATALIRRRIRQTRELCCDEVVATRLLRPETYARALMRLIGSAPLSRPLLSDTTIGLNQSDILEVRIMSLLKSRNSRRTRLSLLAAALVLLAPCVVVANLALRLEVAAQEPVVNSREQEKQQRQSDEKSVVRELRLAARQLEQRLQDTKGPQRAEIEQRLREVKKNLEEHERAVSGFRDQQEILEKYRASLQEFEERRSKDMAELEKAQEKYAQIVKEYPRDEAAMREAQSKLAELYKLSQTDRKAKLIYRVEPEYAPDAREKKIEGTVLLGVTVGHDGLPQSIQIKKSLYPSLDEKAVEAVRKWRFEPALKDGQPVSMYLHIEVDFSLYAKEKTRERDESASAESGSTSTSFNVRRKKELEEQGQDDRARRQAELAQGAVISMDRAIQIAISKYPGKVLACSLGRDKDGPVFYHVVIIVTEGDKTTTKYVWVSAVDGTIIKSEGEPRRSISSGVLNGRAITLPQPQYPEIARAAKAEGQVTVEVTIDEQGNVIEARAISGHPLLQGASVKAARQAKFAPTYMAEIRTNVERRIIDPGPVTVTGRLTYNFVAQ